MAFVYWVASGDGDWSTLGNWSGAALPGSGDVVAISSVSTHTVTHNSGNDFISSLSIGNDVFQMGGGALTIAGVAAMASNFGMSGGTLSIGGVATFGAGVTLNGGSLVLATTATVAGNYSQAGGTLTAGGTVSITGAAQLQGGAITGNTVLQVGGTIVMAAYDIAGSAKILNAHTLDQTGNVTLGDNTGVGVTIDNEAGATYAIANPVSILSGAATASLVNAGTLSDLAGTGASAINVSVTSTGTVTVGTGSTLGFNGPLTNLSGSVGGAGTLAFGGGTTTIASGTVITAGGLSVTGSGTTLAIGGDITLTGAFSQRDASILSLGSHTLTIDGAAQFQQYNGTPTINGTGTLLTKGTTNLVAGGTGLVIGGSVGWVNDGTVILNDTVQIGNGSTTAASLTNAAGGVFNIVSANVTVANGSTPVSVFKNAGTLEMTANAGTSYISTDLASTGTVSVAQGDNLEIDGAVNSLSGTLSGAGQLSFGAGATTLAAGTTLSVATLAIYTRGTSVTTTGTITDSGALSLINSATLTLGGALSVAGSFTQNNGAIANLGGYTLTLAGAASFQDIGGAGALVTKGTTTVSSTTLGGSVTWTNSGTVLMSYTLQIGDSNTAAASVVNAAGGVFNLVAGNFGITNGSTPVSSFTNAGTLELTGNNAGDTIGVNLASTGTISVVQGDNLELDGPTNALAGSITGAGQLSLGAGTTTIAGGTTISIATFAIYHPNTVVNLGGDLTVSGGFLQEWNTVLNLGGHTLTLAGAANFQDYGGTPTVGGTGTLVTKGTTTLNGGNPAMVLGGSATWDNAGTIYASANLQLGNSNTAAAAMVNQAGAVLDLVTNNIGITNGSTPVSTLTNAGTLEITANSGGDSVAVSLTSTGTISAALGDNLELDGPTNTISGTIGGAGQVSFGGGSSTIAAGTTISVGTLALYTGGSALTFAGAETLAGNLLLSNSNVTMTLGGNLTVSGTYTQSWGTVALGAFALTVNGAAQFQDYNAGATLQGTGKLVTKGTTTIVAGGTALVIGGAAGWYNYGTVIQNGTVQIGNGSVTAALIDNEFGAVFDIVASNIGITNGSTPVSVFANSGTLELTSNGGGVAVGVDVKSIGTVSVAQGDNLEFDGPVNSLSGTLTGAGQIAFGGGSTTIAGGTSIKVGTLAIYNNGTHVTTTGSLGLYGGLSISGDSSLTLGGAMTVLGSFSENYQSVLSLGGFVLTLSAAAQFQDYGGVPDLNGSGTLVTKGATDLIAGGTAMIVGGKVAWQNYGAVTVNATLQVGDSNTQAASVLNEVGGVFDITVANVSIVNGSTPISSFTNAGTLEMTASSGTSYVNLDASSTGTVTVATGDTLEFDGPVVALSGTLTGAGEIALGAGTTTIAGGTTITPGLLALYHNGTTLALGGSLTVSGGFSQAWGSVVSLGAFNLTLLGNAEFQQYSGAPDVTGTGALITKGTTKLDAGGTPLTIGGAAAWDNYGTVLQSGSLQLGDSLTASASLVNETGGVFDIIASGIAITSGSTPASTIVNDGLLEMTAVGGSSTIGVGVSNLGTILAQGGALALNGAITGTGTIEIAAKGSIAFGSTVASTQTVKFEDATGSASISLSSANSFGATLSGFVQGNTIDLQGITNATAKFAGGVLTFTDNTSNAVVAQLHFSGAPNFTFASDGHGGTTIGDPPLSAALLGLGEHLYFTNSGGGMETIAVTGKPEAVIGGFSLAQPDRLDLTALLAGSGATKDLAHLGSYLTTSYADGNTTLSYDATGHGHGSAVAVLTDTEVSVGTLLHHGALVLG